jgi:shikimate kinase
MEKSIQAIVLMGPFGSGKSHLGRTLAAHGIAHYADMEPLIYERFGHDAAFDVVQATQFLRASYHDLLSRCGQVVALESTGVVQRPLLQELQQAYTIALVRVLTPKELCLQRVAERNVTSSRPIDVAKAAAFYEYWTQDIAPSYTFALTVDGSDALGAVEAIHTLIKTPRQVG